MARQPRAADYKRLPGKAARYEGPGGETISRRAYDNLRFQAMGIPGGLRQAQAIRKNPEFERLAWYAAKASGKPISEVKRAGSQFMQSFADAYIIQTGKNKGKVRTRQEAYRAPHALAALLYDLGLIRQQDISRYLKRTGGQ